jgi:nicotinamide-nucleotide amidase
MTTVLKKIFFACSNESLSTVGAVSEETVKQMLAGVLNVMQTDYAVAVSGIMGPGGGSTEKPVCHGLDCCGKR